MSWLNDSTLRRIGDLSPTDFLRDYWQQKPLFVKNAVPEIADLVSGDDLAGLALEDNVESRIVLKHSDGNWELKRGPFKSKTFRTLPKENWTLLVQAVDQFLPDAADLLDRFNFLPQWRMDDLMVSYAVDGGGVGPHYDSYDVFLIQGTGTRLWKIGPEVSDKDLLPHPDLRILKKMKVTQEFVCEPGDLLYLPPRIAHWGVARGECMTYSVGFRAASDREMLDAFCNFLIERTPEGQRYGDAGIAPSKASGTLDKRALSALRARINAIVDQPDAFAEFAGRWLSEPKYAHHTTETPDQTFTATTLRRALKDNTQVRRDEGSRFLVVEATTPALYVDGEQIPLATDSESRLATFIADNRQFAVNDLSALLADKDATALALRLFNSGNLYFADAMQQE